MTEEQNKLLEQCIRYIGDVRGAFTHDEQLALAKGFRDLALKGKGASQGVAVHDFGEFEGRPLLGISAPDAPEPSGEFVRVPRERLRKLIEWHQREQDELTCGDLCDKTYEVQGCPSGTCALQDGKDELAWWAALAASPDEQKG